MSPSAMAPRIALISAFNTASASEWPTSPLLWGISTPPNISFRPRRNRCASKPCPMRISFAMICEIAPVSSASSLEPVKQSIIRHPTGALVVGLLQSGVDACAGLYSPQVDVDAIANAFILSAAFCRPASLYGVVWTSTLGPRFPHGRSFQRRHCATRRNNPGSRRANLLCAGTELARHLRRPYLDRHQARERQRIHRPSSNRLAAFSRFASGFLGSGNSGWALVWQ